MKHNIRIIYGLLIIVSLACNRNRTLNESQRIKNLEEETVVVVANSERGVLFRRFANGIDTSKVYLPGEYKVKTFDRFIKYNIDIKSETNIFESKTKLGKPISLKLNYSYKLIPEKVALMEYYIGSNYPIIIVERRIQNSIDDLIIESTIDFGNKIETQEYENELFNLAKNEIAKRYVELLELSIIEILRD